MAPVYDPFPKYLQIREIILRWLTSLRIGDRLPTEEALAAQFGVSRVTIRLALRSFEQERIVARRPRLGTWLAAMPAARADNRLTGPIEEFASLGITTETRVARQGVTPSPPDVAAALKIAPGEPSYEIRRVRILDGIPLLLLEAYFPVPIGRVIARRNLRGGLMVPALREIMKSDIREEYQQLDALAASKEAASLLKIEEKDPILSVKRLFVDDTARPVVFFKTNFRADRYYYTVKLPLARLSKPKKKTGRNRRRASA